MVSSPIQNNSSSSGLSYLQIADLLGQSFNETAWPDIVRNLTVGLSQLQRKHRENDHVQQPQEFYHKNNEIVKADILSPPSSAMSSVMRLKLSLRPLNNPEVDIYPPAAL